MKITKMRVNVIRTDSSDTIETSETKESTEIIYQIEEGANNISNYTYKINHDDYDDDDYNYILSRFKSLIVIISIPPVPILDIYYAYKYSDFLNKFAYNINISIQNCLLVSALLSCFSILIVLPTIVLILSNNNNNNCYKINKPFFTIWVYIISIIFTTIWYFIQTSILIGICSNQDTYGYDYNLSTYLIVTTAFKLSFGVAINNIILCKRL